jgi:iron complex transport system permease protein
VAGILLTRLGFGGEASWSPAQESVLLAIRLPRTILAALAGGGVAVAGALLQGLFRNPLADPGLIGVSGGAALAAAAVVVLGGTALTAAPAALAVLALPLAAFGGGLATAAAAHRAASRDGETRVAGLLLAGIALNALAGSATGLLLFVASDAQLRAITFWSLGSLAGATWPALAGAAPLLVLALALAPRLARSLDLLQLGEAEAGHLGLDVERLKRRVIALAALAVGAAVALTGIIGFVGLVVPHLVRLIGGPDHRLVVPGSVLLGAALLLFADVVARSVAAPAEVPIGIVTALFGAPFLLWLLRRRVVGRWS